MNIADIEQLRPLTAMRMLTIWRESKEQAEEPLERSLLCNARILAECCFQQDRPVFSNSQEVLEALTARQMETLLRRLSGETASAPQTVNPNFDMARFTELEA